MRILLVVGVILIGIGLLWPDGEPPRPPLQKEPASQRYTTSGPVIGASGPGTYQWLGIPFAAPPVGELRWRRPHLPEPWSTPRVAIERGAPCVQFHSPLSGVDGSEGEVVGAEDCLYLDIYAPSQIEEGERLPVMFWIHGGGNTIGSARTYDGNRLAQSQRVVVVAVQYRLGLFGWFSHPALRDGANPDDDSGNFGTLDLVAGLEWVRGNIANFGGDPQNITIFGESAGGRNVFSLMASPRAAGLFHRAISQSGATGTLERWRAEHYSDDLAQPGAINSSADVVAAVMRDSGRAQARNDAKLVAADLAPASLAQLLREQDAKQLYGLLDSEGGLGMISVPQLVRDGAVLPLEPLYERFADPANYNSVPLVTGTNRDEVKLFQALDPELVDLRFGVLPQIRDRDQYEWRNRWFSDQWKALAVDEVATKIGETAPVFAYRWDWDEGASGWLVDYAALVGAGHGMEIAFVFGDFDRGFIPGFFDEAGERSREALSVAMMDYWATFARDGDPGRGRNGDLPHWQSWSESQGRFLILDTESSGGLRMSSDSVTATDLKARLREDPALQNAEARCRMYRALFLSPFQTNAFFDAQEYANLGCGPVPLRQFAR